MELEDIENVDKKNVEYINFFYYFLDDSDKLYFSMKNKYNLIKENFISKEEIFDQISYGKNKFLEKKCKLISILVHNNNSNALLPNQAASITCSDAYLQKLDKSQSNVHSMEFA